jgi:hypothetical protein
LLSRPALTISGCTIALPLAPQLLLAKGRAGT